MKRFVRFDPIAIDRAYGTTRSFLEKVISWGMAGMQRRRPRVILVVVVRG